MTAEVAVPPHPDARDWEAGLQELSAQLNLEILVLAGRSSESGRPAG
jgi:hypothetical protein